jgi:hypothetical protein
MSEPDTDVSHPHDPYTEVADAYHRIADSLSTVADQLAGRDVSGELRELIETTAALDRRMLDAHPA